MNFGVKEIRGALLTEGGRISGDCRYISQETANKFPRVKLLLGDVVISVRGTLGKIGVVSETEVGGVITANLLRLSPKNTISSSWLLQVLKSDYFADELDNASSQTTIKTIQIPELSSIQLKLPPLDQQQKIAKILSTVDKLIEKTQSLIDKYTDIKQGMMADLFTRGIDLNNGPDGTPASNLNYGQLRPCFDDAPELYKETELGWVPREWEVSLLDNISTRGSGHTPSKSFSEYWNGEIKWVSLADSNKLDKLFIFDTDKKISELGLQNSSATRHPLGTVILSRDAGIGKSAILAEEMAVSQHFMAWRCGKKLDNYFLYFWLQLKKPEFNAIAMGSTIPTIGLDYFKRLKIAAPLDIEEQVLIGNRILKSFEYIQKLHIEKKKYELIKKGLMQDLLTGKVRVD